MTSTHNSISKEVHTDNATNIFVKCTNKINTHNVNSIVYVVTAWPITIYSPDIFVDSYFYLFITSNTLSAVLSVCYLKRVCLVHKKTSIETSWNNQTRFNCGFIWSTRHFTCILKWFIRCVFVSLIASLENQICFSFTEVIQDWCIIKLLRVFQYYQPSIKENSNYRANIVHDFLSFE